MAKFPITDFHMTDFRIADFHAAAAFPAARRPVSTPARSAASTMEASRMHFPLAGVRVSAEGSTAVEEAFTLEEAVTDEKGDGHDV
jgi:hypothetical protein